MALISPLSLSFASDLGGVPEADLVARVLGGGTPSTQLLRVAERLAVVPFWQRRLLGPAGVASEYGVTPEVALRLAALWELAERWFPDERPSITSARDAVLLFDGLRRARQERVVVVLLDARLRPSGRETIAVGTVNASRLSARDVFAPAVRADAVAVIVGHNHPSGEATPSPADHQVTATVRAAGDILGIRVLDHIIVTARDHYSFREAHRWDEERLTAA